MDYLYIDEKGPQESIRITDPYDNGRKIKLANDNMYVYVANVVKINDKVLESVQRDYEYLEKEYLSKRNFKNNTELKGKDILGKNFNYGIASLRDKEIKFLDNLFDLLLINNVDNMLFSINKMSLVIDVRLSDWILDMEERRFIDSARLLKYSLTKYMEIEASPSVVKSIFDFNKENKEVLIEIQKDMQICAYNNQNNKRMKIQLKEYIEIAKVIKKYKSLIKEVDFRTILFDWNKVSYDIDLWFSEMELKNAFSRDDATFVLDQGIPVEPFKELNISRIIEEQDSSKNVGLRISDILVVIAGNYISKLSIDSRYNKCKPDERKLLSEDWFNLNEKQFYLIKKMNNYLFPEDYNYCFVTNTYFDDALLFEAYIRYIGIFKTYNHFKSYTGYHVKKYFSFLMNAMTYKWSTATEDEAIIRINYGSMRLGIESGEVRPI